MKHIVQFELDDGSPVYVEVEDEDEADRKRVGRRDEQGIGRGDQADLIRQGA